MGRSTYYFWSGHQVTSQPEREGSQPFVTLVSEDTRLPSGRLRQALRIHDAQTYMQALTYKYK